VALRVVWPAEEIEEKPFIETLLHQKAFAEAPEDVQLLVYSGIQKKPSPEIFAVARSKHSARRVLLHLSDEKLRHQNQLYSSFDLVIRNYFDPRLAWRSNVFAFPLGWTSGFGSLLPAQERPVEFVWSFLGATKGDRELMVESFRQVGPSYQHFSSGWNAHDQLVPQQVREIYEKSVFGLCPPGNAHLDTFRVMEVLEAGAIPVTKKFLGRDLFRYTFGDHPFLVAETWADAASEVQNIANNPQALHAKRTETRSWYQRYRAQLFSDFAMLVLGDTRVRQAKPYSLQRSALFDIGLQLRFWHEFKRYGR